jgi:hypothetical protein
MAEKDRRQSGWRDAIRVVWNESQYPKQGHEQDVQESEIADEWLMEPHDFEQNEEINDNNQTKRRDDDNLRQIPRGVHGEDHNRVPDGE